MGTFYTIHLCTSSNHSPDHLKVQVEKLLDDFSHELSNWHADSWVNQFNSLPAGEELPIPSLSYPVVKLSLELAEQSDGLLDPTVEPLVELWGFGVREDNKIPSNSDIETALELVGHGKIILDENNQTIRKTIQGVRLNFSATAKGYAVDLVAELLQKEGITNFLINIGGEITSKGKDIDDSLWKVAIQKPGTSQNKAFSIELENQAIATSGTTQNYFTYQGVKYAHIINPKTGWPVKTSISSVSILAPQCALADGLATLAILMDEAELKRLIRSESIPAQILNIQ